MENNNKQVKTNLVPLIIVAIFAIVAVISVQVSTDTGVILGRAAFISI